jgi:hypothetical protein
MLRCSVPRAQASYSFRRRRQRSHKIRRVSGVSRCGGISPHATP